MNNLLTIGKSALTTAQAWVSITGDNIANADTAGYTRRYVVQKEAPTVTQQGKEVGLGSNAEQVLRYFDKFLQDSYLDENTISERWQEYDNILASLESLFNEANTNGLSATLNSFFNAWQKLALNPDDPSVRTSVLNYGQTLKDMFGSMTKSIQSIQNEMDISINGTVDRINELSQGIGALNKQISAAYVTNVSNPNSLLDERDALVEELATLVDIKTIDSGGGQYRVQLTNGQPLVDGLTTYDLEVRAQEAENRLQPGSGYSGQVRFNGSDDFEYTIEIVSAETNTEGPKFRVSLDGGKTWIRNSNNSDEDELFEIPQTTTLRDGKYYTDPILVKDIEIYFENTVNGTSDFSVGDKFDIVPKSGLYWIEPTRGPENITPQITTTGADNADRVTGGKLAAYYGIRDDCCGRYMDELDALANTLIWEVNRQHSQGAGLTHLTSVMGQESVINEDAALGKPTSGNTWYKNLEAGSVNLYFYDTQTSPQTYVGAAVLDFNPANTIADLTTIDHTKQANFDPATHSLKDVVTAIENAYIIDTNGNTLDAKLTASIQNGKIIINTEEGSDYSFAFGQDTTGILAALGINTFFSGDSALTLDVSTDIAHDYTKVCAERVDGQYESNEGDNAIALAIGTIANKNVKISTFWKTVNQTLPDYYAGLVSTVGTDKLHAETNRNYHTTLSKALLEQKESVSGVNLDEEMTNLVKYQSAYKAAAKLITTADEMLGVLIGLKQ